MKFEELIVLLPCHSLEDFPVHYEADEAEAVLSAWSALWHPRLIASAEAMPTWQRVDCPPETLAGRLVVVPEMCDRELPAGYISRAEEEGAAVVRKLRHRHEIVAAALAALDDPQAGDNSSDDSTAGDLAADFLALGFLYLQVELLTRRMRYMSNIDQANFNQQVVAAAKAYVGADHEETRRRLQNCFDVLAEAREHFYPVDAYLIDVVLTASTTFGEPLRQECAGPVPVSVLLAGEDLAGLAERNADMLAELRTAWADKRIGIIGGSFGAVDPPLADPETVLADFRRGLDLFEQHLGHLPAVWGSRRFALAAWLPQLLSKTGFAGAWHVSLDEGRFPQGDQAKSRWEGLDGTAIDVLGRLPVDAARADSFLGLSVKMGESMDHHHVACVVLAHWPGQVACWHEDLRRGHRYAPVLGKFVTIEDFFGESSSAYQFVRFEADEYRSPLLKHDVAREQPDPISRHVRTHQAAATQAARDALHTIAVSLGATGGLPTSENGQPSADPLSDEPPVPASEAELDDADRQDSLVAAIAARIPRVADGGSPGVLVFNSASFTRRLGVNMPAGMAAPQVAGPVLAAGVDGSICRAVVEVPPLGFAWVGGDDSQPAPPPKRGRAKPPAPMADASGLLQNGFIEAHVNLVTGALQSFRGVNHRKNLVSQQLAFRTPGPPRAPSDPWSDPDEAAIYSVMAADRVTVTSAGPVLGEIVAAGRLLDHEGKRLAGYRQTVRLWRSRPVLEIDIELDVDEQPRADPWNSYYGSRFAWADETANLFRSVGGVRQPTELARIEAPHYIDLDLVQGMATIFTLGLPYHRTSGPRMLDTLLVTRGETARRFRLGLGLGIKQPMAAALDLLAPPARLAEPTTAPAVGATSWFFHVDVKNVIATHWSPLVENGKTVGFRTRLLETLGRPAKVRIASLHPIATAREVDFLGKPIYDLCTENGNAIAELAAGQWLDLEARW
ncbi:MAG: hypothetical protein WD875_02365 [Pirellulales bacterium]